ncbi:histidine phosphatase family protein [Microbacterium oxydans]|nr:histidine phosphatase family protein [Microbacterium oxydans]
MSGTLILLRHGQSTANADGLFTGISNPTPHRGGDRRGRYRSAALLRAGMQTRCCFTSTLDRAINTASRLAAAGATARSPPTGV